MAERMQRTQILLEPKQHQQLSQLAQSEKRSMSDVIREMLDAQLELRNREASELLQRRVAALQRIAAHHQAILEKRNGEPLPIPVQQLIDQMREERDEQNANFLN